MEGLAAEKAVVSHEQDVAAMSDDPAKAVAEDSEHILAPAQARRLRWKIDLRVLPMLGVLYAISVIDRNNIGSAKVLGLSDDLQLGKGARYSIILLLFFPAYTLADLPSNWLITRVQPHLWLSFLLLAWGAVLTGMAFTSNWQVMAFLRFLLGAFEGGVLPGMVYMISCW